ncbi:hypothetical protein pEaSNUABM42_00179 [Erwinia phage pEa_SNUABM_42]|nr:hypothetical protein pEaSNUABM43_00180 [Erwinia phage pEa_SNUABM_43]QVW55496.1 hypothetical protein pEaSNUABM42_00179 [Erwinia phage pEa_SNUABM_42]
MASTNVAKFTGTLLTTTYPNKYNVVIPPEGPFFRTGLELKNSAGVKLIEGLDYYLGYYYKEAAVAMKDQIYGGIMLINGDTSVDYTIYSVGREYRVPQTEIGKFLVKEDIKDPRNTDWSELMRYAPVIPAIDPPANLDEALLRDEVVKALDDIRQGLIKRAGEMDAAYTEVTDLIFANGKKIFDDNLYSHHRIKNAHQYTADEIGALKVLTKAIDSTKAFGKTLDELVAIMKANGIQQTHIDTLMPVVLGELRGRLKVLNNGALTFRTADSSHVITLQGDKFLITTTRAINITADADSNERGVGVELGSGLNTAYVLNGAVAPIFNGAYLVTPDMVSLYLSEVKLLPGNAYFSPTDTIKVFGTAKQSSPLTMNAQLPTATDKVPGLFAITNLSANISSGTAISQYAVNVLKKTLDDYVDNTYTINGKKFIDDGTKQSLTLTATDLGVGNINNTAPAEKPLTNAIRAVLANKSLANHTHTFADLTGVPTASDTDAGLLQLWDAIDNTTNKVVTSKQGYNVQQRLNEYKGVLDGLMPSWTTGGAAYGNPGYLPIPAVGNYAGFAKRFNQPQSLGVIKQEADTVYALRNANDGLPNTDYIYYSYAQIDTAGLMVKRQQTSYVYQPAGMSAFPGVKLVAIVVCGEDAMVCLGTDNKYYTIMFDGTLNQKKHLRVWQTTFPTDLPGSGSTFNYSPNQLTDHVVVYKDRVYILRMEVTNNYYRTFMLVGTVNANGGIVFASVALTGGTSRQGVFVNLRQPIDPGSTTVVPNGLSTVTAAGLAKWQTRNIAHGPQTHAGVALKNATLRVGVNGTIYLANADGSYPFTVWPTSFVVDMDAFAVTLENPEIFPLKIDVDGVYLATGEEMRTKGYQAKWAYGFANNRTHVYPIDNSPYFWTYFDPGDAANQTGISRCVLGDNSRSLFDHLEAHSNYGMNQVDAWVFNGGVGSVLKVGYSGAVYLGNNAYLLAPITEASAVYVETDPDTRYSPDFGGLGPSNVRRAFDLAKYYKLGNMTWCASGSLQNGKPQGAYWTAPGSQNYQAVGDSPTADVLTISQSDWNTLLSTIKSQAPSGSANAYANEYINAGADPQFSVWAIRPKDAKPIWLVQVAVKSDRNSSRFVDYYLFQIYPTVTGSTVTFPITTVDMVYGVNIAEPSITAMSITYYHYHTQRYTQPIFYEKGDGTGFLHLPNVYQYNVVGGAGSKHFEMKFTLNGSKLVNNGATMLSSAYYYNPTQLAIVGNKLARTNQSYVSPAYLAGPAAPPEDYIANVPGWVPTARPYEIVAGVKTAEGWELYITESESLRFGSDYYTLDAYNQNLKTLFPGAYQNRTFYMHAAVVNGKPEYQLLTQKMPDTNSRLFIGTVVTDSQRILSSEFTKVKRLGELKQLTEHAEIVYSHDVNVDSEARLSRLGLLRKQPLAAPAATGDGYLDVAQIGGIFAARTHKVPIELLRDALTSSLPKDYKKFTMKGANVSQASDVDNAYSVGIPGMSAINSIAWRMIVEVTPSTPTVKIKLKPGYTLGAGTIVCTNANLAVSGTFASALSEITLSADVGVKNTFVFSGITGGQASAFAAFSIANVDNGSSSVFYTSDAATVAIRAATNVDSSTARITGGVLDVYKVAMPAGVSIDDYFPIVHGDVVFRQPIPVMIADNALYIGNGVNYYGGTVTPSKLTVNLMPKLP